MQDFRKLKVWEKSYGLTLKICQLTKSFPDQERYGLVSQIRRAAVSIASNIAEGSGRGGRNKFPQFLRMAFGSSCELEYQILLAHDLGFVGDDEYRSLEPLIREIKKNADRTYSKSQSFKTDN